MNDLTPIVNRQARINVEEAERQLRRVDELRERLRKFRPVKHGRPDDRPEFHDRRLESRLVMRRAS